ncbi:MAG: nucleoside monophosphate kinase [bacterium]|nr:nucleoside monophosphate kinase [bacterium]
MPEDSKLKTINAPQTLIFIGRSGSGKGTQARLLEEYLKKNDPARAIYYLETGALFRKFIAEPGFSQSRSKAMYERSVLQPSFLAVYLWTKDMIMRMTGDEHLIIDGTPRYHDEARVLTTAMRFYDRVPTVIYLDVPRAFSEKRLHERGRLDDKNDESVKKRLDWFDTSVTFAIEYMKNDPVYRFVEIDGSRSIEEVHKAIVERVFS